MASKDFMSPKPSTTATQTTADCGPKTYGTPARPGEAAAAKAAEPVKKQAVNTSSVSTAGAGRGSVNPPFVKPDNTYAHETNNTVVNGSQSDNFDKINLNLQFQPNVLDSFDAVTYHFKLFITDPDTSSTGAVFIIAESGVTDLTIDKVEIRSVTTPSIEGGTGVSTNIKFEIIEPSGAGLIDKMFYQSVALGIGNWAVMPVYLQLQFRGRDPLTSGPDDGAPGSLASLKWLWSLKISRIKANVTHVGTRYEFEAIVYNDFAQSNAIFTLQHNVVLNNIETFSDAMKELQNKLNADQLLKLIDNYSIPDSFKIIVDPKISEYKITPGNKNTNSRRNDNFGEFDNKDATFQVGTAVDKIIDTLLAQTDEYQKSMLGAPTPGAEGLPMNEEQSQMKKFWRIITETRPLKFDARRQDIAKEFTIFVVEYDIGVLDSNVFQTSAPPITAAAQRKRLMTYVQKAILKKKYNYIFTGVNDQIINFDITINNAFANAQARFGGIYLNPFMADKGVVTHEHAKEEAQVTAALSRAISFQNNSKTANTAGAKAAMEDAKTAISSSNLTEETKSRYRTLLEQSKPESRLNYLSTVQQSGGINNNGDLNTARTNATVLSKPVTERVTEKQFNFISDVNIKAANSKSAYTAYMENSKGKLRPVARIETLQDRQIGMGIESNSNSGIQKLSTMFSVALHSGLDSSLQKIKMTIKGDPFWVFPQPFKSDNERLFNSLKSPGEAIDWIKNAHFRYVDSANIYGTDNFILIRFRTPQVFEGANLENNADENSDVETLSGIYKVNFITNRFEAGKFTQELDCMIDPEISILNIADQIEADAQKKDKATSPDSLTQKVTIPETATKKDRIMGSVTDATGKVTAAASAAKDKLVAKGAELKSNIPEISTNALPGLPNTFG
jgi:hypothetical protein